MTFQTQPTPSAFRGSHALTQMLAVVFAAFTLFTVAGVSISATAQADSASHNKGYREGKKVGRQHGSRP